MQSHKSLLSLRLLWCKARLCQQYLDVLQMCSRSLDSGEWHYLTCAKKEKRDNVSQNWPDFEQYWIYTALHFIMDKEINWLCGILFNISLTA